MSWLGIQLTLKWRPAQDSSSKQISSTITVLLPWRRKLRCLTIYKRRDRTGLRRSCVSWDSEHNIILFDDNSKYCCVSCRSVFGHIHEFFSCRLHHRCPAEFATLLSSCISPSPPLDFLSYFSRVSPGRPLSLFSDYGHCHLVDSHVFLIFFNAFCLRVRYIKGSKIGMRRGRIWRYTEKTEEASVDSTCVRYCFAISLINLFGYSFFSCISDRLFETPLNVYRIEDTIHLQSESKVNYIFIIVQLKGKLGENRILGPRLTPIYSYRWSRISAHIRMRNDDILFWKYYLPVKRYN